MLISTRLLICLVSISIPFEFSALSNFELRPANMVYIKYFIIFIVLHKIFQILIFKRGH